MLKPNPPRTAGRGAQHDEEVRLEALDPGAVVLGLHRGYLICGVAEIHERVAERGLLSC